MANDRNAGRKKKFDLEDKKEMLNCICDDKSMEDVAKKFKTSRQVIARYLNAKPQKNYTHRMTYMWKHKPQTIIDIDFLNQKIKIQNRTNDLLNRAFGVIENPTWKHFEIFLRERVFDESRIDKNQILKNMGLDSFDPIQIINITHGKINGDNNWIKMKKIN